MTKGSSDRRATIAKSGKRSGHTTYPASASPEKLLASELGETQFISNQQLNAEREATIIIYNQKTGLFEYATRKILMPTEHKYDVARGRVVYSPSFKEKGR